MNLAKIKNKTLTKTFEYSFEDENGEQQKENVTITFLAHFKTPAFMNALSQFEQTRDAEKIAKELAKVLVSWDLTWQEPGKEPEPFPPNFENLSQVCEFDFLALLCNAMVETFSGNAPKPNPSVNSLADSAELQTQAVS